MTQKQYSQEPSCHESLEALLANQLIPPHKSLSIRPIGTGEVLRRIIGKAVMWVKKEEVVQVAGSSLCRSSRWHGITYSQHG